MNLEITGAEDGELVPDAQIEWSVVGNDGCAPNITATHSRDGVDLGEYPKGALLDQPGSYSVTIQAINCVGVPSAFTRNFAVNEPPVVVPIPGGHPKRDPNDPSRYLVKEGTALTVNGSASTAPENDDSVAAFEWDWDKQDGLSFPTILNDCDPAQAFYVDDGSGQFVFHPWDEFHGVGCVRIDIGTQVVWPRCRRAVECWASAQR